MAAAGLDAEELQELLMLAANNREIIKDNIRFLFLVENILITSVLGH
jgi:hypothetical protein